MNNPATVICPLPGINASRRSCVVFYPRISYVESLRELASRVTVELSALDVFASVNVREFETTALHDGTAFSGDAGSVEGTVYVRYDAGRVIGNDVTV